MIHSLSPLFLVLTLCEIGCFPAAPSPADSSQDVAQSDVRSSLDAATLDTPGCAVFDALSYIVPDVGLPQFVPPGTRACLVVGVNDACNGDPIRGATVELRMADGRVVTQANDFPQYSFFLDGCRGENTITVSKAGYRTTTIVMRPAYDRAPGASNQFTDDLGVRLVPDPDAGR